jgi:hypothetical protein
MMQLIARLGSFYVVVTTLPPLSKERGQAMFDAERHDPETCFRRGYHQGAFDAIEAAQRAGVAVPPALVAWAKSIVNDWRYGSTKADRNVRPPAPPAPPSAFPSHVADGPRTTR